MIYETYSERHRAQSQSADVYQYEEVPQKLRVQVQQILADAIGPHYPLHGYVMHTPDHNPETWEFIKKTLCREFGVHSLAAGPTEGQQVINFLGACSVNEFVDAVELCTRVIDRVIRALDDYDRRSRGITDEPDDALKEINHRFRKSGLGFQFVEGQALRVDSEFVHEEVVKPALRILNAPQYEGARDEFLSAHRHYRNGDHEEAITEAAKSFESTMKAICERKGWTYSKGARASDLLKVLRANHLWPDYLGGSFDQLVATLSSGLPQVRNDSGAHGQGTVKRDTPGYIAAYALHLAASKLVLMAEAAAQIPDLASVGQPAEPAEATVA
jgi:hypothetical protein